MSDRTYNAPLHRAAVVTAVATFPLIFMGGLVTSHGAGMSVPDWPNSYGYNMFAFPFSQWLGPAKGGIFYEHLHRLMASGVGLLTIIVATLAWTTEKSRPVRWLATAVLGGVIFQGVLGGLRVVLVNLNLAVVHACVAQAFFCMATLLALVTSRWWIEQSPPPLTTRRGRTLIRLGIAATLAIYLQLIAGALMRHYGAGLAIPDLPYAYGKLLPPTDGIALAAANKVRAWDLNMDPVSLGQVWLHFAHRAGAVLVSVVVLSLSGLVITRHRVQRKVLVPGIALIVLLAAQVSLGVYTVLKRKPADVATLHVACGALLLMTCFVLTTRAVRVYAAKPVSISADVTAGRPTANRDPKFATV